MATDPLRPRVTPARATALAAATLVGACTMGPNFHRPETTPPPSWAGAASAPADLPSKPVARAYDGRLWWSVFRDPMLDGLVDEAVRQNLDLQTAALRIEEARAQRGSAASQGLPQVNGSGIGGRQRASKNGLASALTGGASQQGSSSAGAGGSAATPAPAPSPYSDLFDVGFDATWELDLWGKVRRGVEAADASIVSAEQARGDAMVSMTAEVARTYLSLRGAQRQRAIVLADIDDEQQLLKLTNSRANNGFSSQADAVQQQAQLSASQAQLPPIDQNIDQAMNRLALLLALPPGALADRLGPLPQDDVALPPEVPVGLPGDLLRRRPDILKSEADLHAATAKVGQAKAQLFPSITLGGTAGLQSIHADSLTDWASRFWVGGAQVSIPIFEGGKLKAQIRTADAQMKEAALAWRGTVLSAYHDANNALVAYADEQRHASALARQLADARRGDELMRSRFKSGFVSMIDVLDAQRNVHQAEQQALQSNVTASTDLVALYKALGGDWSEDAAAKVASTAP
ncbi:efflux transporter outer membrane subunit [Scleromatobacter humisilvae]|uniref:Efflux transporter outer membrane subunit n=1 Tax=Scleromatobacter humisilvae TaxID=2897159 RepID=A0A9X1YH04_9BURK|nr:efflux transporter outer membrane subunit [Scleromatobacter humisilvae]MCK9684247.1 efflux transporter outer membrane subunit [Scleromatobacter humisilvae]